MRMNRRQMVAGLVLLGAIGGGADTVAYAATGAAQPKRGGTLHVRCISPATSMDPATSKQGDSDQYNYMLLYDRLVRLDDKGNIHPELATSWTIDPAGTKYTFHLRSGVTFSDGTDLKASDVVATLLRYKSTAGSPLAIYLQPVTAITAPDSRTVVMTLSQPSEPLLIELGNSYAGISSGTAIAQHASDLNLHPVGSGPFTLKSWTPGAAATFARNPHYWKKGSDGKPLPYLDSVVLNAQGDSSVALLSVKSGTTDYDNTVDPADLQSARADKNLVVTVTGVATGYAVAMNAAHGPFTNKTLRQAVQHAINCQAILNSVTFGTGYTTPMGTRKQAWYYIGSPAPKYDPKLAKQKLTAAGYPNGMTAQLSIINRSPDTEIAQIVQSQLKAVGITINIQTLERTTWVNTWYARQGEIGLLIAGGGAPSSAPSGALNVYNPASISDFSGYSSDQMTGLINQANTTTDKTALKKILKQADELAIEDAPYVFIGNFPIVGAARKGVRGIDGTSYDVSAASKGSGGQ